MVQTSGVLFDSIQRHVDEEFIFTNGSSVFTYGATSFIKGKHNIHFCFANEAGDIPEHVFENVLLPMLGTAEERGHFGVIGVPAGQQGYLWKTYQRASKDPEDERSEFYLIHLPTSVNKYYGEEQLRLNKELMSHDVYMQEHEAQFLGVKDALFSGKLIDSMKKEYDLHFGIVDHKLYDYYLGLDWGRSESWTVGTIMSQLKETQAVKIDWIKGMKKDFGTQIDWVTDTHAVYKFRKIVTERMGLGIPPSDILRSKLGSRIVKFFLPTPAAWFEAFTDVRDAALNQKLTIPAGELKLLRQLRLLTFTMRANKLTVRSEGKDDYAQSFAIAYSGIRRKGRAGVAGAI